MADTRLQKHTTCAEELIFYALLNARIELLKSNYKRIMIARISAVTKRTTDPQIITP